MKAKKLLAIMSALCMLLTLVPMFSAAAATALPTKPEANLELAATETAVVGGKGVDLATYDKEAGTLPASAITDQQKLVTVTPDERFVSDNYVVKANICFANGWDGSVGALTVADGAVLTADKVGEGTVYINGTAVEYSDASRTPLVSGDGATFAAHVYPGENGKSNVDFYYEAQYVGTVTGVTPNKRVQVGTAKIQWGDVIAISGVSMYNVEADPEVQALPFKPTANVNLAMMDSTSITGIGTGMNVNNLDKTTGSLPQIGLTSGYVGITATPATRNVNAQYVVSATVKFGGGWERNGAILAVGDNAQMTVYKGSKDVDNAAYGGELYVNDVLIKSGNLRDSLVNGAGAVMAAFVYPNAANPTLNDVDWYYNNVFVTTTTGVSVNKNLMIRTVRESWGDHVTFSNLKMYNAEADPEFKEFPTVPSANVNLVLSENTTLSASGNNLSLDNFDTTTASFGNIQLQNNVKFVAAPNVACLSNRYLVQANVLLANGWNGTVAALTVADGAVLKANKDTATGGDILINDTVVLSGYRTALTTGDGLQLAAYVYANGLGTYDVDFYVDGAYAGSVEEIVPNKTLTIGTAPSQWGDYMTLSNAGMYNVDPDPEVTFAAISIGNAVGGTATAPELAIIGGTATLTATPSEGYAFLGWKKNDDAEFVSTEANYTFTVTESAVYTPVFAKSYTVTIGWTSVSYTVNGAIGVDAEEVFANAGSYSVLEGETVSVTMILDESKVAHFKNGDNNWSTLQLGGEPIYTIENIDKNWNLILQPETKAYVTVEIRGNGTINRETGWWGEHSTVIATGNDGWEFSHFEVTVEGGTTEVYTDNPWKSTPRHGSTATVVAVFKEMSGHLIHLTDAVGGTAEVIGTTDENGRYVYGTIVTLKATPATGYEFAYWMIGNRTYAAKTTYLTVNANVTVTPVFTAKRADEHTVTFYSVDGRVIDRLTSTEIENGAELPAVPYRYGYTNGAWDFEAADGINSDKAVYPTYTKSATTYTVTVVGGIGGETVEFETRVKVAASVENFTAWVDEEGNVLSTDYVYSFLVTRDITITAATSAADANAVTINPTSLNTSTGADTFTMSLVAQTTFTDDYYLVECGFVYTTAALDEDTLVIGAEGVKRKVSTKNTIGQFVYTLKNAPKSATITARAYMVLADANGETFTVYSNLCDASWK